MPLDHQEQYADFNVRHFRERLREEHNIRLSYTWVKLALQGASLVAKGRKRGVHRKRRKRRPLAGMMLHLDGRVSIAYAPHVVGRYRADGTPLHWVRPKTRHPRPAARKGRLAGNPSRPTGSFG